MSKIININNCVECPHVDRCDVWQKFTVLQNYNVDYNNIQLTNFIHEDCPLEDDPNISDVGGIPDTIWIDECNEIPKGYKIPDKRSKHTYHIDMDKLKEVFGTKDGSIVKTQLMSPEAFKRAFVLSEHKYHCINSIEVIQPAIGESILYEGNHGFSEGIFQCLLVDGIGVVELPHSYDYFDMWKILPKELEE